jgi:hypothetical protein
MLKSLVGAAVLAVVIAACGCASGETTQTDLDKEREAMEKQTPANLDPVKPPDDTVMMGGGKGG